MAQPSKVGPVFLTIFALPFLGGGLFFLYGLLVSNPNVHASNLTTGLFVASFFVLVGAGLIFASFKGYGLLKKQAALRKPIPFLLGSGVPTGLRAAWKARTKRAT